MPWPNSCPAARPTHVQVSQKAALYRQLQKQKQEVQDKEFQDLIERGLNPYEIHRKKDMEAQVCLLMVPAWPHTRLNARRRCRP